MELLERIEDDALRHIGVRFLISSAFAPLNLLAVLVGAPPYGAAAVLLGFYLALLWTWMGVVREIPLLIARASLVSTLEVRVVTFAVQKVHFIGGDDG